MSLISYYSLAGEIRDLIKTANGQSSGVSFTSGALNVAAVMNGASITTTVELSATYSIGFWIRLKSNHTGSYRKFLQVPGASTDRSPGFWFHPTSNRLHLRQSIAGTNSGVDTITALTVDKWYHLVFVCETYMNNTTRLSSWLNGEIETTNLFSGYPNHNGSVLSLLSGDYDIEALRVYDHALSKREIVELSRGLVSQYRLTNNTHDVYDVGTISIGSGQFIEDPDEGDVVDITSTHALIPKSDTPITLKGESITFRMKCSMPRAASGGGSFSNHICQWGGYYTPNSGGFGLQSGTMSYYLKGPGSPGWTNTGSSALANDIYDRGGWISYAFVFTSDNRLLIYMQGQLCVNQALSSPYTELGTEGIAFGVGMQAQLSNLRLYKSELTPDAVVDIHKQRASMDDRGSIYSCQITERVGSVGLSKIGLSANTLSEVPLGDNLVCWHPLLGDLLDKVSPTSMINHGATPTARGYIFDRTIPSWLELNSLNLFDGTKAFSVFIWALATGSGGSDPNDCIFNPLGEGYFSFFVTPTGYAIGYFSRAPVDVDVKIHHEIAHGQWVHLGMTFNPTTKKLCGYVNGQYIGQTNATGTPYSSGSINYLGKDAWPGQREFDGVLRDLRVFSDELSLTDVQLIHRASSEGLNNTAVSNTKVNTQGRFNEVTV